GHGMTVDYDAQLYYRRSRAWGLLIGDPQAALQEAGDRLWGEAAEIPLPDAGAVTLDFEYGTEADAVAERLRRFFREEVTPADHAMNYASTDGVYRDLYPRFAKAGLLFPDWPKEYGGGGLNSYSGSALRLAYAEFDWNVNPMGVADLVGRTVMQFARPDVKE